MSHYKHEFDIISFHEKLQKFQCPRYSFDLDRDVRSDGVIIRYPSAEMLSLYFEMPTQEMKSVNMEDIRKEYASQLKSFSVFSAVKRLIAPEDIIVCVEKKENHPEIKRDLYKVQIKMREIEIIRLCSNLLIAKEVAAFDFLVAFETTYPDYAREIPFCRRFKYLEYSENILAMLINILENTTSKFGFKICEPCPQRGFNIYTVGFRVGKVAYFGTHQVKLYAIFNCIEQFIHLVCGYRVSPTIVLKDLDMDPTAVYKPEKVWCIGAKKQTLDVSAHYNVPEDVQ